MGAPVCNLAHLVVPRRLFHKFTYNKRFEKVPERCDRGGIELGKFGRAEPKHDASTPEIEDVDLRSFGNTTVGDRCASMTDLRERNLASVEQPVKINHQPSSGRSKDRPGQTCASNDGAQLLSDLAMASIGRTPSAEGTYRYSGDRDSPGIGEPDTCMS